MLASTLRKKKGHAILPKKEKPKDSDFKYA